MKKASLFLLSFLAVLLVAIFISPILFPLMHFKFERIFNRIVMIGTLLCVVLFVRLKRENLSQYGLSFNLDSVRMLLIAFICPVIVLSVYGAAQIFLGQAVFSVQNVSLIKWVGRIISATSTGLLIGLIEEQHPDRM